MIDSMIFIIFVLQFILIVQFSALMAYLKNAKVCTDYRLDSIVYRMESIERKIDSIDVQDDNE